MSYTLDVLNKIMTSDGSSLLGELPKLNKYACISFRCKCGTESDKIFVRIKISGMLCTECTNISRCKKREKTNLEKYGNTCSLQAISIKKKSEETCLQRYGVKNALQSDTIKHKIKQTNLDKYGVENPFGSDTIKQKLRDTCKEKYGSEFPMQNKDIAAKTKATNMDKYGVPVSSQAECVKEKAKETNMQIYGCEHHFIPEVIEKGKKTNLEKYGVEYTFQVEDVKDKIKQTLLERYGVEHNMQCSTIKEKVVETNMNKYGVPHYMMLESSKKGVRQTNMEKYGVESVLQSAEIQEKSEKNGLRFKEYKTPLGQIRNVQGYEPFALDILLKDNDESDVITSRKEVPRIEYIYNNKPHYYFPDIWIKSQNKLIEVKSMWTFNLHKEINVSKWNASIATGCKMEFWIFDAKKNLTIVTDPNILDTKVECVGTNR